MMLAESSGLMARAVCSWGSVQDEVENEKREITNMVAMAALRKDSSIRVILKVIIFLIYHFSFLIFHLSFII
jgi:hypothetical protein